MDMRLVICLVIGFCLLSCARKPYADRFNGRIYKAKEALELASVPNKGYPIMERIPYRDVENVQYQELFDGLQLKYDSIQYCGTIKDTILGVVQEAHKFQVQISSKFPEVNACFRIRLQGFIDNTSVINIHISEDHEHKLLKEFLSRSINSTQDRYHGLFLCNSEATKGKEMFFGTYGQRNPEGADFIISVLWINNRVLHITKGKEVARPIKIDKNRISLHRYLNEWSDFPSVFFSNYVQLGNAWFLDESPELGELPLDYLNAIRLKTKADVHPFIPNIGYDRIWDDAEVKAEAEKIFQSLADSK